MKTETLVDEKKVFSAAVDTIESADTKISNSHKELISNSLIRKIDVIKIRNDEELEYAVEMLEALKAYYKTKDTEYKGCTDPIKKGIALIKANFDKITNRVQFSIDTLNNEIKRYYRQRQEKIDKANAEKIKAAEAEKAKVENKFDNKIKGTRGETRENLTEQKENAIARVDERVQLKENNKQVAGSVIKERWAYEIINEKLLPEKYTERIPKRSAIKSDVDAGIRVIPGCNIYKEIDIAGKSR